jgi:hypothetical protein
MVLELLESAANMATDPKRVYDVGAGFQLLPPPGAPLFSNEALPQTVLRSSLFDMLDGLRQGLVSIH